MTFNTDLLNEQTFSVVYTWKIDNFCLFLIKNQLIDFILFMLREQFILFICDFFKQILAIEECKIMFSPILNEHLNEIQNCIRAHLLFHVNTIIYIIFIDLIV